MEVQRPPFSQKLIFALGQLGWSLASFGVANLLVYFYLPPDTGNERIFPVYIYEGAVLGIATVIGLISFGGRFFDAMLDPLVAIWSDKINARIGKRRMLMALGVFPFAAFSVLAFYPPSADNLILNTAFLFVVTLAFYFFLTVYNIPFSALIGELGHDPADRMLISTMLSVAWALGFLIGSSAYAMQDWLEHIWSPVQAFQLTLLIFAGIALVFMTLPVLFLNEKKYCLQLDTHVPAREALKAVLSHIDYRRFLLSDLMYWLALTFIQLGVGYYVTILFQFDKAQASTFLSLSFVASFVLYVPVNRWVSKYGKKRMVLIAFWVFMAIFGITFFLPELYFMRHILFYTLAFSSGFPLAVFGIVPNALIADLVYKHQENSGLQQSALFYAVRNFTMKTGISLANLIFPSLLLLGKSVEAPLGVRLSTLMALLFCCVGWKIFTRLEIR